VNDYSALCFLIEHRRGELLREAQAERLAALTRASLSVAPRPDGRTSLGRVWSAILAAPRASLASLLRRVAWLFEPRPGSTLAADGGADCLAELQCVVCWEAEAR